jgi:hypothetical protein
MADVLSGALLAEEAAHELALGDARKALVAKRFLEKAFGPKELKLGAELDPVHVHFKDIVSYTPIAPEKLGYAATPAPEQSKPKHKSLKP